MNKVELHLHTNNNCNLRCAHCYNNSGEILSKNPDHDNIINTIQDICTNYDAEIHLEGGEIFLIPQLLKKMYCIPEKILKSITITTNGTIFTDDTSIINMLKKIKLLRVSVEGYNSLLHEEIRGGSFNAVIENARRYQELGIPVCIRITLNRMNYDGFVNNTIMGLYNMGFENFQVYEFQSVGRGLVNEKKYLLGESINELLDELCMTSLPDLKIKMMFSKRREKEILTYKNKLESNKYEVSKIEPSPGLNIDTNGDVYLCAWDNNRENIIFNMYSEWNNEKMKSMNLTHECNFCSSIKISNV